MFVYLKLFVVALLFFSNSYAHAVEVNFNFNITGTACFDGVDNDMDGLIDYPNDPDCSSPFDDSEGAPPVSDDFATGSSKTGTVFFDDKNNETSDLDVFTDLQNLLFTFPEHSSGVSVSENNFVAVEDEDSLVDEYFSVEEDSFIPFQRSTRFTLPQNIFEKQLRDNVNSYELPSIVFFDVITDLTINERPDNDFMVFSIICIAALSLLVVFRFTLYEFTDSGIKQQIYHPCHQRIIFSISSFVLALSLVFLIQTVHKSETVKLFGDEYLNFEIDVETNDVHTTHNLLFEFYIDGEIYHKDFLEVANGKGSLSYPLVFASGKGGQNIDIFISYRGLNMFVSQYSVKYSKFSQGTILMFVLLVTILICIIDFLEYRRCFKQ